MTFNVQDLEKELKAEFDHYHIRAQIIRFSSVFAATFLLQLAAVRWTIDGWAALWSLLLSCAVVVGRQMFPSIPWNSVLGVLHDTALPTTSISTKAPVTPVADTPTT
jgi:hypothetical protein